MYFNQQVLDHLAKNKVLTLEHIYSPPRSGTEWYISLVTVSSYLHRALTSCIYATSCQCEFLARFNNVRDSLELDTDCDLSCMYSFSDTLFDLSRHDDNEVLFSTFRVLCYILVPLTHCLLLSLLASVMTWRMFRNLVLSETLAGIVGYLTCSFSPRLSVPVCLSLARSWSAIFCLVVLT